MRITSSTVRLGLIGAGRWGQNYIRTISGLKGVELVAIASTNPKTHELAGSGCKIVADWHDILTIESMDAVVVATPPALHAQMLFALAKADKAILLEKPLVQSLEELAIVQSAIASSTRVIMVGHTHLFHPAFQRLLLETRERGPILGIRASAGNLGPYRPDVRVLWDWGPHDLAMCLAIDPGPWTASSISSSDACLVEGAIAERLRLKMYSSKAIDADLFLSTLDSKHRWFAVDFADGTLIYQDQAADKLKLFAHPGALPNDHGRPLQVCDDLPLTRQLLEFVALIREGAKSHSSLALGMDVVRLLHSFDTLFKA